MGGKKSKISTLWYALLGLIKMHPNTGYGLRKIFEDTPMARYSSSPGAIYPALRNLETRKLISGQLATGKTGRKKQTFRCTAAGTRALNTWLRGPVSLEQMRHERDVLLLRFSFLDLVDDFDWSQEFLRQFIAAAQRHQREIAQNKAVLAPHQPLHGQLALANGLDTIAMDIRWAKFAAKEIQRAYRS